MIFSVCIYIDGIHFFSKIWTSLWQSTRHRNILIFTEYSATGIHNLWMTFKAAKLRVSMQRILHIVTYALFVYEALSSHASGKSPILLWCTLDNFSGWTAYLALCCDVVWWEILEKQLRFINSGIQCCLRIMNDLKFLNRFD